MAKDFLNVKLRCLHCGKISKIADLRKDEYLLMIEGYFCPCDNDSNRPLAGENTLSGTQKFYLKFAEVVG